MSTTCKNEVPRCFYRHFDALILAMLEIIIVLVIFYITVNYYRRSQMLENYGGRHVMITGCDTGFGNMLAKRLDSMGFSVFAGCLTEKGGDDLQRSCSNKVKIITLDVTSTESVQNACNIVKAAMPPNKGKCNILCFFLRIKKNIISMFLALSW